METKILSAHKTGAIQHAVDVLHHGGLVAFPTDTVYGLAALLTKDETIDRLYVVKGRNHTKAIAALIGRAADLDLVTKQPGETALQLAKSFWPGPLTIIVPRHPDLPAGISPLPTIGVRMPDHPIALKLLALTGPLAVTSANLSGEPSPITAEEVNNQLAGRIHLILDDGETPGGIPSTVVDCTTPELAILRPGPISQKTLVAAITGS